MKILFTGLVLILFSSKTSVFAAENARCLVDNLDFPGLLKGSKSSFRDGEVFVFKCDPKYKEANANKFICEDGNWIGPVPPCTAGSCLNPVPSVENAKAEVSSTNHLSVVKYVCEEPYVLVETSQVQCFFGEWEGIPPRCAIGKCFLKDLEHSEKVSDQTPDETISGNELSFRCDIGYHSITEKPLCVDGKWTRNFKPLCKISSCLKSPPVVANAKVIIPSTSHTSELRYECKDPYILVGNSTVRCMFGEWRGQPPKCEDSTCYLDDLDLLEGVSDDTNSATKTGEELNVICDQGYDVNPVKPLCLNGIWTKNSDPLCVAQAAADCNENPPPISHGISMVSTKTHGSLVKYVCEDSYMLNGKSHVQCIRGVWRGYLPKCIDTRCYLIDLQRAENISPVTPNVTLSGDRLNVTCDEGYTTRPVIPLCLNGKWNRNFLSPCKEMTCYKPPPKVKNAVEEVIYRPVRTIVKYRCKEHYVLEGSSQIECMFGEWRGQLPKCTDKNCADPPPNVIHATVEIISTPEKKIAKYVCIEPYLLVGNSEIPCSSEGWNRTAPTCKDSRCYLNDLKTAENLAEETPTATNSGEKLNAICKAGYTPGEEKPVCQNGTWIQNSTSICKESTCTIPEVDHGDILEEYKGEFYFNLTKLEYHRNILHIKMPFGRIVAPGISYMLLCYDGYVLQGKSVEKTEISCIAGKWSPEPVCVVGEAVKKLTTPREPDPVVVTTPTTDSPALPTTAVPEITSKCTCQYLSKDENLIATVDGKQLKQYHGVQKGAEVVFRCLHVGFHRFDGFQELHCENCEEWKVTDLPRCTEPEAGNTIILFDSEVNISEEGHLEVRKGQSLEFSCVGVESTRYPSWNAPNPKGVSIKRRGTNENSENIQYVSELYISSVEIEDEGSYDCAVEDNPITTIQVFVIDPDVKCPEFPDNEQVDVTYKNERHVRSKAYFSCKKKDEELFGKSTVRCLKNGKWSGPVPKCREIKCRKLKKDDLLSIYYTDDRKIGSFATFHCSAPGKRVGEPFARCLENGLWSKSVPKCERVIDPIDPSLRKNETAPKPTMPSTCFCTYNYLTNLLNVTIGGRRLKSSGTVRRGDVVSFSCLYHNMNLKWQNGLRLLGPVNLTCECENFKVQELPTCEIRKSGINVFAYDNKMKFLPGGIIRIARGENIKIQCINLQATPHWNTFGRDGLIISSEFSKSTAEANGFFVSSIYIREAEDEHSGRYECLVPLGSVTPLELQIYDIEETSTTEPTRTSTVDLSNDCSHCTYDYSSDLMLIATVRGRKIQPREHVKRGEVVSLNCRYNGAVIQWQNGLEFLGEVNLTCRGCEKWKSTELPTCEAQRAGGSYNVYNDKMNILPGGVIEITRGHSFEFQCVNHWLQPMWDADNRKGIHFEDDPVLNSRNAGQFSTYMLIDEVEDKHAGTYRCFATDQIRVYEGTKMLITISTATRPIPTTTPTAQPDTTTVSVPTQPLDPTGKCYCIYDYDPQLLFVSTKKRSKVGGRVVKDAIVSFTCRDPDMKLQWSNGMKFYGRVKLLCDDCRKWERNELPTCDFVDEEDSLLFYDDKMRILPNGDVEVPKGDSVEIRCVNSLVQPQWHADDREGIYFSNDSNTITQDTGLYSSYMLIDEVAEEHAGEYRCSSNELGYLTLNLQVSEFELLCPELPLSTEKDDFIITYEDDRKLHSFAQYQCKDRTYSLIGNESRVCMENGQWSGTPPSCEEPEIQCPELSSRTKRGRFIITYDTDRKLRSTAHYSCQDKTKKLIGGKQRTCLKNGKWSGTEPSCEDLTCPDLPLPNGLLVFYTGGSKIGSTIKFRCPRDKTLVGNTSSTCQADGTWDTAWPSCENYMSCERFETPLALEITYSDSNLVGSEATFHCLPPHTLSGKKSAICLESGVWSEPQPWCEDYISCDRFESPPGLEITYSDSNLVVGSEATFHCLPPHTLSGRKSAICLEAGVWSEPQPRCEGIPVCRISKEVSPGLIVEPKKDFYRFGDYALLSCAPGMILTTKTERVLCVGDTSGDLTWSDDFPDCIPTEVKRSNLKRKNK